jgi:hypothetical protein
LPLGNRHLTHQKSASPRTRLKQRHHAVQKIPPAQCQKNGIRFAFSYDTEIDLASNPGGLRAVAQAV